MACKWLQQGRCSENTHFFPLPFIRFVISKMGRMYFLGLSWNQVRRLRKMLCNRLCESALHQLPVSANLDFKIRSPLTRQTLWSSDSENQVVLGSCLLWHPITHKYDLWIVKSLGEELYMSIWFSETMKQ